MLAEIKKIGFLIAIYTKALFSHKKLLLCAFLSGISCLLILLGAAIVFGPNDHFQKFTEDMYCQWMFDAPVDYSLLDAQLKEDADSQAVASVLALAKTRSENGYALLLGLSDDLLSLPETIMYNEENQDIPDLQCYLDPSFIPREYSSNMKALTVDINGVKQDHVGKTFSLPYDFPYEVISQAACNKKLSVSCNGSKQMREKDHHGMPVDDDDPLAGIPYGYIYVPLSLLSEQHVEISAVTLIMQRALTPSARKEFEEKYRKFNISTFNHPELSSWSRLTYEMLGETATEMWLVEIIMFACMINQLVFWEILMRRLKPSVNKCYMVGGSKRTLKVSMIVFLFVLAFLILILGTSCFLFFRQAENCKIELSLQGAVSIGIIWTIGFICYCLPFAMGKRWER